MSLNLDYFQYNVTKIYCLNNINSGYIENKLNYLILAQVFIYFETITCSNQFLYHAYNVNEL